MRTVRRLIRALRDEDEEVRAEAADRLGEMGPAADAAIPALVAALGDDDPSVRCRVAQALDRVGVGAGEAGLAVEGVLRDEDGEVRAVAARLLIARQAGNCIAEAVETLAEVPPEAGSPDHRLLIEALLDDRPEVSRAAAPGLAGARPRPGGPSAIDLDEETAAGLEKLLGEVEAIVQSPPVRPWCWEGDRSASPSPRFFACLLGNDEAEAAGRAIADLTAAPGLLPADLRPIASDLTEWDDGVIVDALGIVGVPHGPAFAAVVGAMSWGLARDHYRNFRHDVIGALGRTGPGQATLINILAEIVWDDYAPELDLENAISLLDDLGRGKPAGSAYPPGRLPRQPVAPPLRPVVGSRRDRPQAARGRGGPVSGCHPGAGHGVGPDCRPGGPQAGRVAPGGRRAGPAQRRRPGERCARRADRGIRGPVGR